MEINAGSVVRTMAFSVNGEYIVSGAYEGVRVTRVEDGKQVATLEADYANSLAISKNDKWFAAGTSSEVIVWDMKTYEKVWTHKEGSHIMNGVEFSPDSSRVVTEVGNGTLVIWDLATREQVLMLHHESSVSAAKYSPEGDRIATATYQNSVRVWDCNNGRLLLDIKVKVTPWFNTGLLWFNNHLFVLSHNAIRQFDASTGSELSEWPVTDSNDFSCIALPKHGEFIAYSTKYAVTFLDTSTHARLRRIKHSEFIRSIAFSPDDRLLAIGGDGGKITVKNLSRITDSVPLSRLHRTLRELDIQIDTATLDAWKHDQLADAEVLLSAAFHESHNSRRHILASRSLVRARLQQWDTALIDAEMAISLQPSIIGYIAKSVALVGKGKRDESYQVCDVACERFHSSPVGFLLLIKAIIVFMAGEHRDAISRLDDLIATDPMSSIYYVLQAYMHFHLGNSHMESRQYDCAIRSFEHARAKVRKHTSRPLLMVSLISGWKLDNLGISIQQRLCEALYAAGRSKDAFECYHHIMSEFSLNGEYWQWALDFRRRASKKLEHLGDTAVDAKRHDEAISHYTAVFSLDPTSPQILIKRCKAYMEAGSWNQAVNDANQVITLDPLSPWGYEMKRAALHQAGDYDSAIDALEVMLSKLADSPDPKICQHCDRYISPSSTRAMIRKIVQRTMRRSPRILIDTTTGRLHDRAERASAFESLPIFNELVSSTTTRMDYVRIKREVRQYFRYVMLSHKWEDNEPLFQQMIHKAVYDLDKSPTHDKLRTFCKIVRDTGFKWAWSDTCCIDKSDHFVLQEALVAMFKWYQGSAIVIVFLRGVRSSSKRGDLVGSIWNTRAWTLQEYVAAKVIHFYTEDWTLYLDLKLPNHKESPEVILEMEEATGVSAQKLMALHPGLMSIREKLRLASTRQTTWVEDAAYSLLGIFSVAGIPAIYGEGEASLGRLLAHILAGSGDVSILAWTGESGSFNSCLPAHITVFNGPATSHIPPPIPDAEMERIIAALHFSSFDLDVALMLYDSLDKLSTPWFAASRMKLPCIAFQLPSITSYRTRSGRVYRVDTIPFGTVEIKTRQDLTRMNSLYLIHPWLDALLEREGMHGGTFIEDDVAPPLSPNTDNEEAFDEDVDNDVSSLPELETPSLPAPMHRLPMDRETRAQRLVARLRQPFGALLITLVSTGRRAVDYKRVAADSMITVQFQENVSLTDVLDNVRTLDVL